MQSILKKKLHVKIKILFDLIIMVSNSCVTIVLMNLCIVLSKNITYPGGFKNIYYSYRSKIHLDGSSISETNISSNEDCDVFKSLICKFEIEISFSNFVISLLEALASYR